jgi:hypothetical protein
MNHPRASKEFLTPDRQQLNRLYNMRSPSGIIGQIIVTVSNLFGAEETPE